jgi:hypothetical protein
MNPIGRKKGPTYPCGATWQLTMLTLPVQRLPYEEDMRQHVLEIIKTIFDPNANLELRHRYVGMLVKGLSEADGFGKFHAKRAALLGDIACQVIGMSVCREEDLDLKKLKKLARQLPPLPKKELEVHFG